MLWSLLVWSVLAQEPAARGKRLFEGQCAPCHGMTGTGGRGPSLAEPKLRRAVDERALVDVIRNGIPGTEMPAAWQMTEREIREVADYVRSLGRVAPEKLPGDPERGRRIYESKGGCAACHIVRGQGASMGPELTEIGARRSAAYLREALVDPDKAAPDGFLLVRVVTGDGKAVRGIRASEDSFTIQIRDASNRFHSFRKHHLKTLDKESGKSLMPSYRDTLTPAEIDDLIAYLAGLRGEP